MDKEELLMQAAREIAGRNRRRNGIPSEMESIVLYSSRKTAENIYQVAALRFKEMPKAPRPVELPRGLGDMETASAELREAAQRFLENAERCAAESHELLALLSRHNIANLFIQVGVGSITAGELTELIFSQG